MAKAFKLKKMLGGTESKKGGVLKFDIIKVSASEELSLFIQTICWLAQHDRVECLVKAVFDSRTNAISSIKTLMNHELNQRNKPM